MPDSNASGNGFLLVIFRLATMQPRDVGAGFRSKRRHQQFNPPLQSLFAQVRIVTAGDTCVGVAKQFFQLQ